jgi:methyl-accepting chemotaxis protein
MGIMGSSIAAAIVGLAIQVCLCLIFCWSIWRQRQSIQRLEAAEKGQIADMRATPWLAWVADAFPFGTVSSRGWSRDDAFEKLDELLQATQLYQILQRMAVIAPLVGVLITAFALSSLNIDGDDKLTINMILATVSPLFLGVKVGAGLSITNQFALQIVEWRLETLRETAHGWFDRAVWPKVMAGPRESVDATITALNELGETIKKSARVQQGNTRRLRRASRSVTRASLASERAFRQFGNGLTEFSSQIQSLQKAAESTRLLAQSMEPSLRESGEALHGAVKGFREAVIGQFVPAAKSHGLAAKSSAESSVKTMSILGTIDQTTRKLLEQGEKLAVSTIELGRSGDALRSSITANLVPAQESLQAAAGTLDLTALALPGLFETSASAFSKAADQLRSTLKEDLGPAAIQLRESIKEDLTPMAARQRIVMQDVSKVSDGLKEMFELVQKSSKSLEERYQRLAEGANKQSLASEEIYDSIQAKLIPSQVLIGESAANLARSANELARFLNDGLGPATARLAELGQIIEPMRQAAGAIGALGDLNTELGDLAKVVDRLRQAVDSASTLSELESILGQLNQSFQNADALRQTVSEMPELFGRQINDMSREALRRQADDLTEILADIAKQFDWFPRANGGNGGTSR